MRFKKGQGFTLIELLVVIAIISLLASVVFASLTTVRAKGRDAKAIREFTEVRTALNLYLSKFGTMPTPISVPVSPEGPAFTDVAQQLVAAGFLRTVPVAPINHNYMYYNYGSGNTIGALLVTNLEGTAPSTGYPGTCRPWPEIVNNWCEDGLNNDYCLCNPY